MSRAELPVRAGVGPRRNLRLPDDPRHLRRLAGLLLAVAAAVFTLGTTLTGNSPTSSAAARPVADSAIEAGPPHVEVLSRAPGAVQLYVPIDQRAITAIAYHPVQGSHAYSLQPVGRQSNAGLVAHLVSRVFGSGSAGERYYVDGGSTQAVDVGAAAGTAVYAPVNGQIVSITPNVINGDALDYGVTIGIQPTSDPSLVVNVSSLRLPVDADGQPTVLVGQHVNITPPGSPTRLGTVVDLSQVVRTALRKHVADAGNDVSIEVDPAPALNIP